MPQMTAGALLVETLRLHGVDRAFCVPGESYLACVDALVDNPAFELVVCRHEGGAGFMALADAKLTGRPGVCFVSRGPGATNASIAVHTAQQDAVPLLLLVGQIERKDIGRGAFQEVDYRQTFGDMAKSVEQIVDPDRTAEVIARAWQVAVTGTPGPVVVALPEDMLEQMTGARPLGPQPKVAVGPAPDAVAAVAERVARAERPVLVAGGGFDNDAGRRALLALSEAWQLPVTTTFKHQDLFPNEHAHFAGHQGYGVPAALGRMLGEADLVLAVGTRLGDVSSLGYTMPAPHQPLIHVYPDPAQLGRVFPAEQAVVADAAPFARALAERNAPPAPPGRQTWIDRLHTFYTDMAAWNPAPADDGVNFGEVIMALQRQVGDDMIVTMDGGNFSSWLHRHFRFKPSQKMVGAVAGAMGLGVPSAVAAALRHPDRQVVTLIGDGGFGMTGFELATAVQYGAKVRLFVSNNGSYGTIQLHQERRYGGRNFATRLTNPDFAALARAFGAKGLTLKQGDDVDAVVAEALATDGPVVVDVRSSLEHIIAWTTLSEVRAG